VLPNAELQIGALLMNVMKVLGVVALLTLGISPAASSQTDSLGVCMVDSLDGKERKLLARWIFFSIAAHPEITSYFSASEQDVESNNRFVGRLVTRLLVEDCPTQLKAATKENPLAVQRAFELVGQVAMQEIMTNPQVKQAIANYGRYADQNRISAVLGDR